MDESFMTVLIAVSVILPIAITGWMVWKMVIPLFKRSAEAQAILATGVPAQARVVQVALTDTSVNDQPEVRMLLDVYPAGQPPYRTEHVGVVSMLAIPRIQPGCALDVRIDRQNPARVAVVWS